MATSLKAKNVMPDEAGPDAPASVCTAAADDDDDDDATSCGGTGAMKEWPSLQPSSCSQAAGLWQAVVPPQTIRGPLSPRCRTGSSSASLAAVACGT
eukprot:994341-Pelagomonas_calceolata.AAC.2